MPLTNSSKHQRQRIADALREAGAGGLTTIAIREALGVMMPAARIHELRWDHRLNIQAISTNDTNAQGNKHHCARYVLLPGKWRGVKK